MMLYTRPPRPADFDAAVAEARDRICHLVAHGYNPESSSFPDIWRRYKKHFSDAQHGKCAYCECDVTTGGYGDVEHFHPKATVQELTTGAAGPKEISRRGYWWLAYEWDNYLFCCERCNRSHKRGIFPVRENPRRLPPSADALEEPLLLNCYDARRRPAEHLRFDDDGGVEPHHGSVHGWETIRTCGLNREDLQRARAGLAARAYECARDIEHHLEDDALWRRTVRDLRRLGEPHQRFAGVVRSIVEQELGMAWEELMAALEQAGY